MKVFAANKFEVGRILVSFCLLKFIVIKNSKRIGISQCVSFLKEMLNKLDAKDI